MFFLKNVLIVVASLLLVACQSYWVRMESPDTSVKTTYYNTSLPAGWVKFQLQNKVQATLDGFDIQQLAIKFAKHENAFEKIEKHSSESMLSSELADLFIANLKAEDENGLPSLEILSSSPITIQGISGFELELRFVNNRGLRYKAKVAGFASEKGFFTIFYRAPVLHFFERDKKVYSHVIDSFKFI